VPRHHAHLNYTQNTDASTQLKKIADIISLQAEPKCGCDAVDHLVEGKSQSREAGTVDRGG
jgi:hypothetical protein